LAAASAREAELATEMTALLRTSRDFDIGRVAGLAVARDYRRGDELSPRERDVCELLGRGRSNREIAQALFISESTAKVHVRHIYEKLGVRNRAEAAAYLGGTESAMRSERSESQTD
jgi:DNA-binding NarL/FixJ family response regulator